MLEVVAWGGSSRHTDHFDNKLCRIDTRHMYNFDKIIKLRI